MIVIIMIIMIARTVTAMRVGRQLRSWMMMVVSMIKRMMTESVSYILSFIVTRPREHQD